MIDFNEEIKDITWSSEFLEMIFQTKTKLNPNININYYSEYIKWLEEKLCNCMNMLKDDANNNETNL